MARRRWPNLDRKEHDDGTVTVWIGVPYNANDLMVNEYRWPSSWGWRAPKGVDYRKYKQDSWKAKSLEEWWVRVRDWKDGTLKRGGNR